MYKTGIAVVPKVFLTTNLEDSIMNARNVIIVALAMLLAIAAAARA